MVIRPVVRGLLTFVPGLEGILPVHGTGGTDSARYCYEVWLKHLTLLWESGMRSIPNTLAELGPGDSLGVGLAGVLSGASNYYALDVVRYSNVALNLKILDELVTLFRARTSRPATGWPNYDRYLDKDLFPSHILTPEVLKKSLSEERVSAIRDALLDPQSEKREVRVKYMVPWSDDSVIERQTVDLIISHAVLEHVVDLDSTYRSLHLWLRPGGMMSHQIDFSSHGLTKERNGHWAYPEILWKVIVGKRPFLINRQPCSVHANLINSNGFRVICCLTLRRTDGIRRSQLSSRWKHLSDDDLACSGAFIQAQRE
jgi:hypothetical protein